MSRMTRMTNGNRGAHAGLSGLWIRAMLTAVAIALSAPATGFTEQNVGTADASGLGRVSVGTGDLVISGTLMVPEAGEVVLALTDESNFDDPDASYGGILLEADRPTDDSRVYRFRFEDVAPGRYAIKGYLDTNGNRELDIGMFGPREPWTIYRDVRFTFRAPRFDEVAFDLDSDLTDLVLEFR